VKVKFRASLEDDCAAMEAIRPDLAIGTTPVVQKGKELGIPSLYFTNLISARPLMGPMGAGSLQQVVNAAMGNKDRMDHMKAFFEGVGEGDTAGIWEGAPNLRPDFRAKTSRSWKRPKRPASRRTGVSNADPGSRSRRRLLGLRLRLHRREGPCRSSSTAPWAARTCR
jgi:chlorophyllide a reductase subunit Y